MRDYPRHVVEEYWSTFEPQLRTRFPNRRAMVQDLKDRKPEAMEQMADLLYNTRFKHMPREQFDEDSGMNAFRDAQPTWLETVGQNMGMRAVDLGAGLLRSIDEAAWWLEEQIPLGTIDTGMALVDQKQPSGRPPPASRPMFQMGAEAMEDFSDRNTLQDRVTWEDFKQSPIKQFIPFAMEQGLISAPDMIAAVTVLPVYVAARTGEIGQERAENDLREQATAEDMLYALPAAAVSAMLDRFGAQKLFGITDEIKDTTVREIGKAVGRRAAIESGTEALQEPIEQTGGALGTERWRRMNPREIAGELLEASAQGAVVGAGFGGGVSTATLAVEAARHHRSGGGQGELPGDIQDEVERQKEAARDLAEKQQAQNEETGARPERPPRDPAAPQEEVPGTGTAPEEPGGDPTADVPADEQAAMSDADRSIESLTLEEEANLGARRPLRPPELTVGDQVMVDDGVAPATGTVEVADERLVRVVDENGSPIAVFRPDRPQPGDARLYTLSEEEVEGERDPELEASAEEMGRLVRRVMDDPDDVTAIEDLRRIHKSPTFTRLPASSRDQIDTFIRDADRRIVQQKEAAKTEEERAKAAAKEEDAWLKFNEQWVMEQDKRADLNRPVTTTVLRDLGYESIRDIPTDERAQALARLRREVEKQNREGEERQARREQDIETREALRETRRLIARTQSDPTDMAAVEAVRAFRNSDQFGRLTEDSRNSLEDYLRDLDAQAQAREEAAAAEQPEPQAQPLIPPTLEVETVPAPEEVPIEAALRNTIETGTKSELLAAIEEHGPETGRVVDKNTPKPELQDTLRGIVNDMAEPEAARVRPPERTEPETTQESADVTPEEDTTPQETAPEPEETPEPTPQQTREDAEEVTAEPETTPTTTPDTEVVQDDEEPADQDDEDFGAAEERAAQAPQDAQEGVDAEPVVEEGSADPETAPADAAGAPAATPEVEPSPTDPLPEPPEGYPRTMPPPARRALQEANVESRQVSQPTKGAQAWLRKRGWIEDDGAQLTDDGMAAAQYEQARQRRETMAVPIEYREPTNEKLATTGRLETARREAKTSKPAVASQDIRGTTWHTTGRMAVAAPAPKNFYVTDANLNIERVIPDEAGPAMEPVAYYSAASATARDGQVIVFDQPDAALLAADYDHITRQLAGRGDIEWHAPIAGGPITATIDGDIQAVAMPVRLPGDIADQVGQIVGGETAPAMPIAAEAARIKGFDRDAARDVGGAEYASTTDSLVEFMEINQTDPKSRDGVAAAADYVRQMGEQTDYEFGVSIDMETGEIHAGTSFLANEINVSRDTFRRQFKRPMVFVHNHPIDTVLSSPDMVNAALHSAMVAVGHDEATASAAIPTNALLGILGRDAVQQDGQVAWGRYHENANSIIDLITDIEDLVRSQVMRLVDENDPRVIGLHSPIETGRYVTEGANQVFAMLGFVDYRSTIKLDDVFAEAVDKAFQRTLEAIEGTPNALTEELKTARNRDYRGRARRIRDASRMGDIFRFAAESNAYKPDEAGDDTEGGSAGAGGRRLAEESSADVQDYLSDILFAVQDEVSRKDYRAPGDRSPAAIAEREHDNLRADLTELLGRLVPAAKLQTFEADGKVTGQFVTENGEAVISVALNGDSRRVLRHEAIHALKNMGMFTRAEWSALTQAAKRNDWIGQHGIADRYPHLFDDRGRPTEAAVEEAIADEFAAWVEGQEEATKSPAVRRFFRRIFQFFQGLVSRARAYGGTPDPGNIFEAIEEGQLGSREAHENAQRIVKEHREGAPETVRFANDETEARWKEASKGVDQSAPGRFIEALGEEWRRLTRAREHMPETAEFSDAREKMVHLEQFEHVAKERIAGLFKDVMGGLNESDIDLLTRKMILDDLLWSSEQGMDLPFGLKGMSDVMTALHDVEAAIDARPDLQERLTARNEARDRLKNEMVSSGVLTHKQASNPHYFRHQVLEYAAIREKAGGGGKVTSTYWHPRRGSEKDINANYFQAEADWMYKAYQDIATARFLNWLRTSQYNLKKDLTARAHQENTAALKAKLDADPALGDRAVKANKTTLTALNVLRREVLKSQKLARAALPNRFHQTFDRFIEGGGVRSIRDDGANSPIFGMVMELADSSIAGVNEKAGLVLASVYTRRSLIKETLGDDYVNPQSMPGLVKRYMPDSHQAWQPDSFDGKKRSVHIFTGKTVSQHVLDRALDNLDKIVGDVLSKEQVEQVRDLLSNGRDVRMLGGPMEELILPNEIAETLNDFYDRGVTGMLDAVAVEVTGRWKQWTLFNPARFAKYYLNNVTGDMDALIATRAGKGVAKKIPQAFREVAAMIYRNQVSDNLVEALDKGVVQSSLVMQEVTSMGAIEAGAFRPDKFKGVMKVPAKYFDQVQSFARVRENAFRYAAYLHYKDEFAKGKSLQDIGYGASPPWMVEAITDSDDKAARMARDLLGDYGSIPHRAKWARKRIIPFVSWIASNTIRYNNLFRNAYLTARDTSKAKGVAMGAYAGAGLLVRMFIVYGAVNLWNNLLFGEDEELLGTEERLRLHANLGRWGDDVVTLRFQGALSDYLGWFGLEDAGAILSEVQSGRASPLDAAEAILKGPGNKLGGGITPLYKVPLELMIGKSFFPDIFNPKSIRDRTRHAARTFSLDYPTAIVKQMLGESAPVKSPMKTVAGAIVYMRDPGQMAYNTIRGKAFRFIEHETGAGFSGRTGGRSQALYNWRVAKRQGDERSERLALDELRSYGSTSASSLRSSIKRAAPLGMFPNKRLRMQFLQTLSKRERDMLRRASLWYGATFGR